MTTPEQLEELLALSDDVLARFDGDALSGNPTVVTHRLARATVLLAAENGRAIEHLEAVLEIAGQKEARHERLVEELRAYLLEMERGDQYHERRDLARTLRELIDRRLSQ